MAFYILLVFLIIYFSYIKLFAKYWDKNLYLGINFIDNEVFEHDETKLYIFAVNNKLIPLPFLQLRFRLDNSFRFKEKNISVRTDYNYVKEIFSFSFYKKSERYHTLFCEKRGIYAPNRLEIVARNLISNDEYIKEYSMSPTIIVYPAKIDEFKILPFLRQSIGITLSKIAYTEDPLEFRSIREYTPTDAMKTINWKASAKSGNIMVNNYFSISDKSLLFLLDLSLGRSFLYDNIAEEAIRLFCATAEYCMKNSYSVRVCSNALNTENLLCFPKTTKHKPLSIKNILQKSASIELNNTKISTPLFHTNMQKNTYNSPVIIVISTNTSLDNITLFEEQSSPKSTLIWIAICESAEEIIPSSTNKTEVFRWIIK